MEIDVKVLKLVQDIALIEGAVTVDGTLVATGTLGFARRLF
jgi:3-hydroxymyristoyl/3-hydroxydecanoyl-(acyl carrier protein) dehydratase